MVTKKLIIGLFILAPFFTLAQNFEGGVLAGFVTSQVDGDTWSGYNKSSFSAGVFVNRQFTEKSAAQLEFRYIRKGALEDDTKDGGGTYYKSKLNYIQVPLLYQHFKGNFIFEGGVAFGVLINSVEEDLSGDIPESLTKEFNRTELSALGGIGYQIFDDLRLDFRFEYSMLPVRENFGDNIQTEFYHQQYSFNNVLSFSLYYFL